MSETTTQTEPKCSAHGDTRCAMCSRNDGPDCDDCTIYAEDGMHWDTCPNRDRTPLAEPEWLTSLRGMMTAELTGRVPSADATEIISVAVGVASYHLTPELAKVRELDRERDEAAWHATRLANLLATPSPEVVEVPAGEAREGEWEDFNPATITTGQWMDGYEVEIIHRGIVNGAAWNEQILSFEGDTDGHHSYANATTIRRRPRPSIPLPRRGEIWQDAEGTLMCFSSTGRWWVFGRADTVDSGEPLVSHPITRVFDTKGEFVGDRLHYPPASLPAAGASEGGKR